MADVSETGEAQVEARRIAERVASSDWDGEISSDEAETLSRALLSDQRAEQAAREERLLRAIRYHRDTKWRDNGFRYDDWDSRLYRDAGVHPMYAPDPSQDVDGG